ncbi:MAG: CbiX/SirB N-terminal domain-containing protein [Candidatus Protistobacter heckmanni]|nr:CbiX/SirB N-terminal domain-containing protein [Candidatus Protistobacter heckmanni]
MGGKALILFAHGARDARWREPFDRLAAMLAQPGLEVRLAFLELMQPDLPSTVAALAAAGVAQATVVPVFFGQGGHLRKDLPELIARCQAEQPGLALRCAGAVGEDEGVLAAIAAYCLAQLDQQG